MENLKRNGSGYYDPTAYKAIKNADGGVNMEIYRGDIFYIENKYDSYGSEQREGRPALVVSNNTGNHFSEIVSVVWLTTVEKKPLPTHCEVMSRVPSIALCEQVITVSQNRLGSYIRTATDAEMKEVDKCLLIALGLNPDVTCNEEDNSLIDDLKMKLEGAERELDEAKARFMHEKNACHALQVEMDKLRNEEQELEAIIELLKEENERMKNSKPVNNPEEVVKLKAQVEMLERQNERLLDRLVG